MRSKHFNGRRIGLQLAAAAFAGSCLLTGPAGSQTTATPAEESAGIERSGVAPDANEGRLGPFNPDPPSGWGTCPASGYAPPRYGVVSPSTSYIAKSYEIASPCNGQEVRDAAQAIGMARFRPVTLKAVQTIRFSAAGFLAAPLGIGAGTTFTAHLNYFSDSIRLQTLGKGAKPVVLVASDGAAWNETAPGIGASPAPREAAAERAVLLKLTPFGAVMALVEAEGHAKVAHVDGKTVISGASPYDNIPVTVTLNGQNEPEMVKVEAAGHIYTATFADYATTWESAYYYVFPKKMVWTKDGQKLADLSVTAFRNNPYAIFPKPAFVKVSAK